MPLKVLLSPLLCIANAMTLHYYLKKSEVVKYIKYNRTKDKKRNV